MEFIDNVSIRLGNELKRGIQTNTAVNIAAACFFIYAFQELKSVDELNIISLLLYSGL